MPGRDVAVLSGYSIPFDSMLNEEILADAEALHEKLAGAAPYPHLVLDGLFSSDLLSAVVQEFGRVDRAAWRARSNLNEKTFRSRPQAPIGPAAQIYMGLLTSQRFVQFLQQVTGVPGLVPDPLLNGGGLHESRAGGHFGIHVDFDTHPVTLLHNRLVLITYLNPGWRKEYGGALQLWDEERCVEEVVPEFGRTLILMHSDRSLHGHPDPVQHPDDLPRRSIAAYFYSNGRDDEATGQRMSTHFANPADPRWPIFGKIARAVTPPVLVSALRTIKRSRRRSRARAA